MKVQFHNVNVVHRSTNANITFTGRLLCFKFLKMYTIKSLQDPKTDTLNNT